MAMTAVPRKVDTFPCANRLLNKAEFGRVFDAPAKIYAKYFLAIVRVNEQPVTRLGMIISKRKIAKSVGRNRVRRLIRESFRLRRSRLPAVDLIVLPKPETAGLSNQVLYQDLEKLWQKLTAYFAT
jgi:ribonuclease P protein component